MSSLPISITDFKLRIQNSIFEQFSTQSNGQSNNQSTTQSSSQAVAVDWSSLLQLSIVQSTDQSNNESHTESDTESSVELNVSHLIQVLLRLVRTRPHLIHRSSTETTELVVDTRQWPCQSFDPPPFPSALHDTPNPSHRSQFKDRNAEFDDQSALQSSSPSAQPILSSAPRTWTPELDTALIQNVNQHRYRGLPAWKTLLTLPVFAGHTVDSLRRRWDKLKRNDPLIDRGNEMGSVHNQVKQHPVHEMIDKRVSDDDESRPASNEQAKEQTNDRKRKVSLVNQSVDGWEIQSDKRKSRKLHEDQSSQSNNHSNSHSVSFPTEIVVAHAIPSPLSFSQSIIQSSSQTTVENVTNGSIIVQPSFLPQYNQPLDHSIVPMMPQMPYQNGSLNSRSINPHLLQSNTKLIQTDYQPQIYQCLVSWYDACGIQRRCEYVTAQRANLNKHHRKHAQSNVAPSNQSTSESTNQSASQAVDESIDQANESSENDQPANQTSAYCSHCGFRSSSQHVSAHIRRCHSLLDRQLIEHPLLQPGKAILGERIQLNEADNQSTTGSINDEQSDHLVNKPVQWFMLPESMIHPTSTQSGNQSASQTNHQMPVLATEIKPEILAMSALINHDNVTTSSMINQPTPLAVSTPSIAQSVPQPESSVDPSHVRGYWSPEDTERLLQAAATHTSKKGKIRWSQFVSEFPHRSITTIRAHYRYIADRQ